MSDIALAPGSSGCRTYTFDLPYHVPGFGIGFAISRLKRMGVWEKLPQPLRQKTKTARGSWSGVKITKRDLDAIPDDVWAKIASELKL